ncbi:hypothetical protein [Rariglobus hedericola]|uniref:Verru_Chthon cassette protein A n=1 Tax=Rariglobus hedericola TaxID=2597822 RepID=A0A556QSQ1_9BACT|nr:hypothetical protein [Rariglobus hedericola]TSJ79662.1 hypothetical protein FPL22_10355 [Rariglobus hedericola]
MSIHSPRAAKNDRGFALLITITLLAFLVLLLVSLASLTRVETQVAANSQQLSLARQNALLAMNVALGRLQQLAGPDQRVSATADLVAGRQDAKKNWTGIWDTRTATNGVQMGWLVSGTATTGPTGVTNALSAATGNSLVDLAAANSTGDTTVSANWVRVETEPVKIKGAPGFDPTTEVQIGNYAYWVGDEGVKAKVSLTDPWENPSDEIKNATGASNANAAAYRFLGAQRTGVEGVGKNAADDHVGSAYPFDPTVNPTVYQAFKATLPNVLSTRQLPLANTAGATDLSSAIRFRFHDLTAASLSVMTNVTDGGLKKDLTSWLSKPDGPSNPPRDTDYIANAATYMPRWSQIRSYAGIVADGTPKDPIRQDAEALPTTSVTLPLAAPKQGIYPVITYARIGYNVSCEGLDKPIAFHLFPVVTLWNPHNVPIAAHDFEMRWDDQDAYNAIVVGKLTATETTQRTASYDKWHLTYSDAFATAYLAYSTVTAAGVPVPPTKAPLRFKLRAPQIEAGQSLVFTLKDPSAGAADEYQVVSNKALNILEPYGPNQSDNSVVMYGPTMTAADLTDRYFMSNTGGQQQLSLRDYADPTIVYHWIQNPNSLVRFPHSPINASFLIANPNTVTGPLIYVRASMSQSQGQSGDLTNPSSWFAVNSRWLALFNPIAPHALRLAGGKTNSFSFGMDTQGVTSPGPSFGNGNRASIGPNADVSAPASDLIIHEFLKPGTPLFSLAQLQHVNISQMNLYPAYAIGNSLASVYVPRDKTVYAVGSGPAGTVSPQQLPFRNLTQIYDLSYVLNRTLWDKYFFSTVPTSLTATTQVTTDYKLPNARYVFNWKNNSPTPTTTELAELKTTDAAAAHLLINGGFNVNSTSVQAWRALLYSRNSIVTDPADATYKHPLSRYADPAAGISNSTPWQGYRVLSDAQIDNLAVKIVEQVKLRGPFLSLADFVNRKIPALGDITNPTGLKGALQAAIDAVDADSVILASNRINARSPFTDRNTTSGIDTGISILPAAGNAIPKAADTDVIRAHWIGDDTDANANKAHTSRAAFAPGYLSQADLLMSLGPVLTPRSDTFTIRAYGDVQNPATNAIEGRAWCEAVVQRLPDYMETQDAWTLPTTGTNNDKFGRRFRIVSFRWLTSNDI